MESFGSMDIMEEDISPCSNYSWSWLEKEDILFAMAGTEFVSMIVCITAILLVFVFKLHKKFAYRMALYQVLGSVFVNLALVIATVQLYIHTYNNVVCMIGAVMLEYFMWVKLLISLFLLFHIFCLAILLKNLIKLEKVYVALSFLLPILIAWIPFTFNTYGHDSDSWCWIKDNTNNNMNCSSTTRQHYSIGMIEQYALWYGPLALCMLVSLVVILVILIGFKHRYNNLSVSEERNPLLEGYMKKYMLMVYFRKLVPLLVYPVIFFTLFILPIVWQVWHHITLSNPSFGLSLAYCLCYSSVGLFSGIVLIFHVLLVRRLQSWNEYFLHHSMTRYGPRRSSNRSNSYSYDDDKLDAVIIDGDRFRSASLISGGGMEESFRSSSRASNYTASVGL